MAAHGFIVYVFVLCCCLFNTFILHVTAITYPPNWDGGIKIEVAARKMMDTVTQPKRADVANETPYW